MIDDSRRDEPRDLDDSRLVARIAAGDEAAFVIAYDRHSGFVFGSVARFVGDREVAAEVVQDAFMALWRRARQFDAASGSLLTWLLAIARHRAIDRLRAEGRRPARDAIHLEAFTSDGPGANGSRPDVPPELIAGSSTDPGTVASRRWVQAVVRTGISELPEHERQVILLGYGQDLSQSQIAERDVLRYRGPLEGGESSRLEEQVLDPLVGRSVVDRRRSHVAHRSRIRAGSSGATAAASGATSSTSTIAPRRLRSCAIARRVRDLTVPSGQSRRSAIWLCERSWP